MEKSFQYHDTLINYTTVGKGQPVILLHGFGEDSGIWQQQENFLKKYCEVIIPDLPGSGKSLILEKENIEIADYAYCINGLLETEKIDKCILLGHSMGGYIALAFAKLYPVKIMGLGLINSTAFADSEEKKASRKQGIKMIEEHGAFSFLKNSIPGLFSGSFKKEHNDKIFNLINKGKQFSNKALIQYYKAMMNRPDTTEVLKTALYPVLFIMGTEDSAAPLKDLLQQVHLPQISHIHIIENVGHMSMIEKPKELNKYIHGFVESIE